MALPMAVVNTAMVLLTVDTTVVVMAVIALPAITMAVTPEDLGHADLYTLLLLVCTDEG